jgi:Cu-Zn family superoxide dismutase
MEGVIKGVKLADLEGKSVIVHAGEDDLKTDPSGKSGGRIAGGAIEMKK